MRVAPGAWLGSDTGVALHVKGHAPRRNPSARLPASTAHTCVASRARRHCTPSKPPTLSMRRRAAAGGHAETRSRRAMRQDVSLGPAVGTTMPTGHCRLCKRATSAGGPLHREERSHHLPPHTATPSITPSRPPPPPRPPRPVQSAPLAHAHSPRGGGDAGGGPYKEPGAAFRSFTAL